MDPSAPIWTPQSVLNSSSLKIPVIIRVDDLIIDCSKQENSASQKNEATIFRVTGKHRLVDREHERIDLGLFSSEWIATENIKKWFYHYGCDHIIRRVNQTGDIIFFYDWSDPELKIEKTKLDPPFSYSSRYINPEIELCREYDDMTEDQMREFLKEKGIINTGRKNLLKKRIKFWDSPESHLINIAIANGVEYTGRGALINMLTDNA